MTGPAGPFTEESGRFGAVKAAVASYYNTLTATLTNKRIAPRAVLSAPAATITINADTTDVALINNLDQDAMFLAPSGTPSGSGQGLHVRVTDNGTARAMAFASGAAGFRFPLDLPAPTTTIVGKPTYLWFVWNGTDGRWDCYRIVNGGGSTAAPVTVGSLYQPVVDVIPASEVTDAYSSAAQSFDNLNAVMWNAANRFNLQGQNWVEQTAGNPAGGAKNDTSARSSGGTKFNMSTRFEFIYTGDKLDLMFIATGAFDCQVYVEHQGRMMKLRDKPLSSTATGYVFRNIKFAGSGRSGNRRRRIRVHLGGNVNFLQINAESSALLYPSPHRPMVIFDGDSYLEPLHNQNNGSDETYFSYGPQDAFFEATGFADWNASQGGTGMFQNGDGVSRSDDTASSINATRWGSASRKAQIAAAFTAGAANSLVGITMPIAYIFHGTINDGPLSGGTANMKARAKVVYKEALAMDASGQMILIHVGNEPYTAPGSGTPGYAAGGANDLNRQGHIAAVAETPRAYYVDPSNPANPWWTGNGANNSSLADQQALITGADNLHGNYRGYYNHGRRMADAIRHLTVPATRAYRQG